MGKRFRNSVISIVLILIEITHVYSQERSDTDSPQNPYAITDSIWREALVAGNNGACDKKTNYHESLWTPAGGCKSCFMNIQHRLYHSVLSPDSAEHCRIAKDLTTMINATYCQDDACGPHLVSPKNNDTSLTYQQFIKVADKEKISTGIVEYLLDTINQLPDSNAHYIIAIGIASRYHLTHLYLDYTNPEKPKWWLYDDFGIGGAMTPDLTFDELQARSMTAAEVEAYYRKYLGYAINAYSKSKTLKNPTVAYGQEWPAYERPLYAEMYFIVPTGFREESK